MATLLYRRRFLSILDSESLEDRAPVLSLNGSSPGAKSKLGSAENDLFVSSGRGTSFCGCSDVDDSSLNSDLGAASFRGAWGGGDGGGGGAREAKHRADWESTFRRNVDRSRSDAYMSSLKLADDLSRM